MSAIAAVHVRPLTGRLPRPWGADVPENHVLVVEVETADGARGTGFSWTPTIGAGAVESMLVRDVAPFAIGREAHPRLWDEAWAHVHEAGGAGVTTIALAGLDLALWDLRARAEGRSLVATLGRRADAQPAYGSGVNLHYELDELRAQAERWVAAGYRAAKMKVGRADLREDVERVRAVREVLGPDRDLMVDANQRWDLERAIAGARALEPFDLRWLEEPLRAEDTPGYAELRRRTGVPVAQGENAHTLFRFRDLLDAGAVDVVQPNVVRVGGITPFLRIAALAHERGVEVAPHLLPDVSAQLAVALPGTVWVEDVEDARLADLGVLAEPGPVTIAGGLARVAERPGLGLAFASTVAPDPSATSARPAGETRGRIDA